MPTIGYDSTMLFAKTPKMRRLQFLLILTCLQPLAHANAYTNTWQVCKLTVKINQIIKDDQKIEATVIKVAHKPQVECPAQGETIIFTPETADYQFILPKKHWPKAGKVVTMRYQYADGECKDRGPCRIEHYPFTK